jgi:hypothetical protein
MHHASNDTVAHLTEALEQVRRELARLQEASPEHRTPGLPHSGRVWSTVPLLLLGTWLLSAQAPATQDDLEERVSELEARLIKGPGTTTRIRAPFEVVGPNGNVVLQVTQGLPTANDGVAIFQRGSIVGVTINRSGKDIAGLGTADNGKGGLLFITDEYGAPRAEILADDGVRVLNGGGQVVAAMLAMDEPPFDGRFAVMRGDKMLASLVGDDAGGLLDISNEKGKSVAQVGVEDGNGYVATLDPKGYAEVEMGISDGGEAQLAVMDRGKLRASLGTRIGAGLLSVSNAQGKAVANVTGAGTKDGGAVIVGNGSGQGVASMISGADDRGLIQVFHPQGKPVVVLTEDAHGGLLQIKNGSGIPVANLKTGGEGGGYWQLTDPAGNPVVDAGAEQSGRGLVRAGPYYQCSPAMGTALVGVAMLPDCIRGRDKP